MTEEQESHLQSIKDKILRELDFKYRKGQGEHGGNLWDRDVKVDIIEEALDLITYAYTNDYKIRQATLILESALSNITDRDRNNSITDGLARTLILQAIEILNEKKNNK